MIITKDNGIFVMVNNKEALSIIASLTAQLIADNPNVGREEYYTLYDSEYFSIGLMPNPEER